jgi:hypothetical protein
MATAPFGAVALRCQAADPGIARKPGGGNLVGVVIIHANHSNASSQLTVNRRRNGASGAAEKKDILVPIHTLHTGVSWRRRFVDRAESCAD